jgi:predicted anti-sigma-YlaC factor YlaD
MTHEEAFLLMMDTLDQVASQVEQDQLQNHLLECAECAAEWESLRAVEEVLLRAPVVPAPAGFSLRVMERLEEHSWARTLGALFALGVGSIVALLIIGVPALLVLLTFSTAYTDPAQFTSWVMWLKDLAAVGGTLLEGALTTLRLFFVQLASTPAVLGWAFAAAFAVGLWAYLVRKLEPAHAAQRGEE